MALTQPPPLPDARGQLIPSRYDPNSENGGTHTQTVQPVRIDWSSSGMDRGRYWRVSESAATSGVTVRGQCLPLLDVRSALVAGQSPTPLRMVSLRGSVCEDLKPPSTLSFAPPELSGYPASARRSRRLARPARPIHQFLTSG